VSNPVVVAITNELILVNWPRATARDLDELRHAVDDFRKDNDVKIPILFFGGQEMVVHDLRDAPPEITAAAEALASFLAFHEPADAPT
jgi:hypothetical protein